MSAKYASVESSKPWRQRFGTISSACFAAALIIAMPAATEAAVGSNAAVPMPVQLDVIAQDLAQSAAEAVGTPATSLPAEAAGAPVPAMSSTARDPALVGTPPASVQRAAQPAPSASGVPASVKRESAATTPRLVYGRSVDRARYRTSHYDMARMRRDATRDWSGRHFVLMLGISY
ncbi:hypothetical protein [Rhodopseudomonas sp. B29]|uniref:hypothetical protein n=1 Tax=Rhodopseudomonas sp. B29 TaxID=95607 RepID=UPI0011D274D9|nr:hypothetical protein [Rhodopseudomonas sp. B29]